MALSRIATGMHAKMRGSAVLPWLVGALVLYGAAFLITMGVSVPLNNELAHAGPPDLITDLHSVRDAYEGP